MGYPQLNYEVNGTVSRGPLPDTEIPTNPPDTIFLTTREGADEDWKAVHWNTDGSVDIENTGSTTQSIVIKITAGYSNIDGNQSADVYEALPVTLPAGQSTTLTWDGSYLADDSAGGINGSMDAGLSFYLSITGDSDMQVNAFSITIGTSLIDCEAEGIDGQPVKAGNEWCSPGSPDGNYFNKDEDNEVQPIELSMYSDALENGCGGSFAPDGMQYGECAGYDRLQNDHTTVIWITSETCEDLTAPDDWCDGVVGGGPPSS